MDTVLVTGGAGYIGSWLVRKLLTRGCFVRVLDRFIFGDESLREIEQDPNLEIIRGDIRHIEDVGRAVKGISTVFDLAAIVGDPACAQDEDTTLQSNYESTKVLVELCKYYGVKRLIFASTSSVYGASNAEITLNEGSWLNPVSLYAQTRIMSEKTILNNSGDVIPTILRLATVFGRSHRMRLDLVVNILAVKAAVDNKITVFGGRQWRPNIHVQDAAEAFILAAEAPKEKIDHEIFNVGANNLNYQVKHIADIVKSIVPEINVEYKPEEKDVRNYRVNCDKIHHILGFTPSFSIEDGVNEIIEWVNDGSVGNYRQDRYYNVKYQYK